MSVVDQPVNRQPSQLLRFLGLSGPDAPNRLGPIIDPGLDLLPWLLEASSQPQTATAAPGVNALGNFANYFTVPDGQRWVITRASISVTIAAAHTYSLGMFLQTVGSQPSYMCGGASGLYTGPAFLFFDALNDKDYPLLASPGDVLGVCALLNTGAAPATIRLSLRYTAFAA